jgi:hypothetical protein
MEEKKVFFDEFQNINLKLIEEEFSFIESSNQLEPLLEQRSPRYCLADRNIIKEAKVAPILQAASEILKKKRLLENLEHKLEIRPSKEDLISSNIIRAEMKGNMASSLQPAQQQLKFHRQQIELGRHLDHRPEIGQLIDSNIMKVGISPNIQAARKALEFQTTGISLEQKLEHRPTVANLVDHNILKLGGITDVAPNIQATQQQIKFQVMAFSLDHKLENRPGPYELAEHHVIGDPTELTAPTDFVVNKQPKLQVASVLTTKLESRPSLEFLVGHGILVNLENNLYC